METTDLVRAKSAKQRREKRPNRHPETVGLRRQLEMFERIVDSIYNGVMVTDANGVITHFNKP